MRTLLIQDDGTLESTTLDIAPHVDVLTIDGVAFHRLDGTSFKGEAIFGAFAPGTRHCQILQIDYAADRYEAGRAFEQLEAACAALPPPVTYLSTRNAIIASRTIRREILYCAPLSPEGVPLMSQQNQTPEAP